MIHTAKFRIYPDSTQERKLNEIFTLYNRVKRIGYNLLFHGADYIVERFGESKTIQQCLMDLNSVTSTQPDNLKAGLSKNGKIDDYHKAWNYINHSTVL